MVTLMLNAAMLNNSIVKKRLPVKWHTCTTSVEDHSDAQDWSVAQYLRNTIRWRAVCSCTLHHLTMLLLGKVYFAQTKVCKVRITTEYQAKCQQITSTIVYVHDNNAMCIFFACVMHAI